MGEWSRECQLLLIVEISSKRGRVYLESHNESKESERNEGYWKYKIKKIRKRLGNRLSLGQYLLGIGKQCWEQRWKYWNRIRNSSIE